MHRHRTLLLLAVAGPPLLLAGLGLAHPAHLTGGTADAWKDLHVVLLPVFPLLALAPWLLTRGEHRAVRWAAIGLGYAYAVLYTALDVLAGIGAGALQQAGAVDQKRFLFAEGNDLADFGVWAYLLSASLAAAVALRRSRLAALPGAVLVVAGAVSFLDSHVYWPRGGLTMVVLAVGWAALAVTAPGPSSHKARAEAGTTAGLRVP